jgi:asparagine N-glycosylation enzyme membrane subunit Stt3
VAMILGAIFQVRMAAYAGLVVAILAGAASEWIVCRIPAPTAWLPGTIAGILIVLGLAISLPIGFAQTNIGQGPDPDWSAALNWMRWNTPEPMGDARAWYRWWPRLAPGSAFAYPGSAYSILTVWDKGWWIDSISRRIPSANGEQAGAADMARFLTAATPDDALRTMKESGAKYAAIGPGSITFDLPSLVTLAGRQIDQYSHVFYMPVGGQRVRIRVYLPAFYRSMAARLYLFDGRRIETTQGVRVFLTTPFLSPSGANEETIQSVRTFASEKEAEGWMALHPYETVTLGSADATVSCVDLEEIPWVKEVFVSNHERIVGNQQPNAVKIFELR